METNQPKDRVALHFITLHLIMRDARVVSCTANQNALFPANAAYYVAALFTPSRLDGLIFSFHHDISLF